MSRWKCPKCGSPKVQIGLPTWYREYGLDDQPGELEFVETDTGADVLWWWCEDCQDTESGLPELNEDGDTGLFMGALPSRNLTDAEQRALDAVLPAGQP